jgi:hypothetical protein
MGKQPARGPAMSAPPPRKRKKKGRPSLLDLQKRSLRLEMLQEAAPPPAQRRPSTRRNPGSADDSDDGRCEKKLRLVTGLGDESAKVGAPPPPLPVPDPPRIRANALEFARNSPNLASLSSGRVRICTGARRPRNFLSCFLHEKPACIYLFISVAPVVNSDFCPDSNHLRDTP